MSRKEAYRAVMLILADSGICPVQKNKHNVTSEAPDEEAELLVRYYFDPVTEQCYPFGAQLCGGNANRFDSLAQCQSFCRKRK
ncbi:unnamed protein product [Gongylonema pulchrum]|uniref:BPTI/Kunitz inhibitor domain-containing protein n=1 Tax=Gongylonema pulchrum TaxID=637853 RepID=A0A183ETN0_9BILA|nr:unnamed protein product [Gongylonema pulchrum]